MRRFLLILLCCPLLGFGAASSKTFTSATTPGSDPEAEGIVGDFWAKCAGAPHLDDWTAVTSAPMLASPKLADLTGDGVDDIILTTYGISSPYGEGWLHAWDGWGDELIGYPIQLVGAPPGTPAIGDLDGNGDPEIVQGTWNYLYVFNADGTSFLGWPIGHYVTQSAALADLDDDGDLEIIVPTSSSMEVFHHNGTIFPGFPVSGANNLTEAAVGDLDGDGDLEIVSGSYVPSGSPSDYVYAWHHDGTPVTGFPVTTAGSVKVPPALADLDNDNALEIIADCWVQSGTDVLYVWDSAGNPKPGWPLNIPYIRLSSPSVADLDLDGDLEIIVGGWSTSPSGEMAHAYHHNGTLVAGFPVVLLNSPSGNVNSTLSTGDIDGDGYAEIVIKAVNHIFALNHDGSLVIGFPVFLDDENHSGTISPTPALGDPDGDGLVEIFAASCYNNVMLMDQSGIFSAADMYWPTFRRDACNRGIYEPSVSFPDVTITMTPYNPPIIIPGLGGRFDFNVAVTNNETDSVTFDSWIMVQLPGGSWVGPVLGPISLTLPSGISIDRDRTQLVPGAAPPGTYIYEGRLGVYPNSIWHSDSFTFDKFIGGDGAHIGDWENRGEGFDAWLVDRSVELPSNFSLCSVFPNPFNPSTTISFALPEASKVNLRIYDVSGRQVATLINGWRDAGIHEVTFDALDLASDLYFARLQAGDYTSSQKMVLVK